MIRSLTGILLLIMILAGNMAFPAGVFNDHTKSPQSIKEGHNKGGDKERNEQSKPEKKKKKVRFKKLKTILFTILLGHFGVHRIYLGTNWKVPLFYTLTLGGGLGLLPLIDLFCVIFTPDISAYEGVSRFFMWLN